MNNNETLFTATDFYLDYDVGIPIIPFSYGLFLQNIRNPPGIKEIGVSILVKGPNDFVNESAYEMIRVGQKSVIAEGNMINEEPKLGGVGKYTFYFKSVDLILPGDRIRITLSEEMTIINDSNFYIKSRSLGLKVNNYRVLAKNIFELDVNNTITINEYVTFDTYNIKNPVYFGDKVGSFLIEIVGLNNIPFSSLVGEGNALVFDAYGSGFMVKMNNNLLGNNVTIGLTMYNVNEYNKELNLVIDFDDRLINDSLNCSGSINGALIGFKCDFISRNRVLLSEFAVDIPALSKFNLSFEGFRHSNVLTTHLLKFHYIAYHNSYLNNLICSEDDHILAVELKCHENCSNCLNTYNNCLSCKPNYFLYDHHCITCEEQGLVKSNNQCLKCLTDLTCSQCNPDNTETCLECIDGYYILNGQCISNSNELFYNQEEAEFYTCNSSSIISTDSNIVVNSQINRTKESNGILFENVVFYGDSRSNLFYLSGFVIIGVIILVILKLGVRQEIDAFNYVICIFSIADQICVISLMVKFALVEQFIYFFFSLIIVICYYLLHFGAIVRFREIFRKDELIKLDLIRTRIRIIDFLVIILNFRLKLLYSLYPSGFLSLQDKTKQIFHLLINKLLKVQIVVSFFVVIVVSANVVNEEKNKRHPPTFFYEYIAFEILFISIQVAKIYWKIKDKDEILEVVVKNESRRKKKMDESWPDGNGVCNLASPLGEILSSFYIQNRFFNFYK